MSMLEARARARESRCNRFAARSATVARYSCARYVAHRATATDSLLLRALTAGRRRRRRLQLQAIADRPANGACAIPRRWAIHRDCAGQSDREKIALFRKGAA